MFDLCSIKQDDFGVQDVGGKLEEARAGKVYLLFIYIRIQKKQFCILSVDSPTLVCHSRWTLRLPGFDLQKTKRTLSKCTRARFRCLGCALLMLQNFGYIFVSGLFFTVLTQMCAVNKARTSVYFTKWRVRVSEWRNFNWTASAIFARSPGERSP